MCGMLGSPQAVGIQTSSGPSTPWLIPSPAFTALSSLLFVIFLLLSHNTSTAPLLSRLPVSRRSSESTVSERACTHKHMSAKQKPHLAPGDFFFLRCYLERVQRYKAELCMPCECIERDYNKLLAWGCSILTSAHCTFIFLSQNKGGHC